MAATMLLVRKRTASIFGETLFTTMLPTMVTTDRSPGIPNTFNLVQDGNLRAQAATTRRRITRLSHRINRGPTESIQSRIWDTILSYQSQPRPAYLSSALAHSSFRQDAVGDSQL